jgi:hypothetical protein
MPHLAAVIVFPFLRLVVEQVRVAASVASRKLPASTKVNGPLWSLELMAGLRGLLDSRRAG